MVQRETQKTNFGMLSEKKKKTEEREREREREKERREVYKKITVSHS